MIFFVCKIFLSSVKKNEFPLILTNKADFLTKKSAETSYFLLKHAKNSVILLFFSRENIKMLMFNTNILMFSTKIFTINR